MQACEVRADQAATTPKIVRRTSILVLVVFPNSNRPRTLNGLKGSGRSTARLNIHRVRTAGATDIPKQKRSPPSLSFGFSFGDPIPEGDSRASLTQASFTTLDRGGVKGSKSIVGDDFKAYRKSIFNVLSSRYTNFSYTQEQCIAELVMQPPSETPEQNLNLLLIWM